MVLPIGMGALPQEIECPAVVRTYYAKWWWLLTVLFAATTIMTLLAGDIIGGFVVLLLAMISWCMVRNNCEQMTAPCVMMFGMICFIQIIFELITLATSIGGRKEKHTTREQIIEGGTTKVIYTTTVEEHPFFDESQGWQYNLFSAKLIVLPIVLLCAVYLCYFTYKEFPDPFVDDEPGVGGGGLYRPEQSGYGGVPGGPVGGLSRPTPQPAASQRPTRAFEGQGHVLGS